MHRPKHSSAVLGFLEVQTLSDHITKVCQVNNSDYYELSLSRIGVFSVVMGFLTELARQEPVLRRGLSGPPRNPRNQLATRIPKQPAIKGYRIRQAVQIQCAKPEVKTGSHCAMRRQTGQGLGGRKKAPKSNEVQKGKNGEEAGDAGPQKTCEGASPAAKKAKHAASNTPPG